MSLDPSPLSPTPTPLLNPTDPVPGRGAAVTGAGISVILAIIVAFISLRFGTQILYFPQGLKAHANGWTITRPFQIQGFNYQWAKSYSSNPSTGYAAATTNDQIFTSEAKDYHMNLVVITVTADQANDSATAISFGASAADGYSDDVYTSAVTAARKVGLTPVFRLAIRVNGISNTSPIDIGSQWGQSDHTTVGTEQNWFNAYTAFAAYYAKLAQQLNMPFLIIGSDLARLSLDGSSTADGAPGPGDTYKCQGRRDCEWRHVVAAVRNASYQQYVSSAPATGGGFAGKVIYAATSDPRTTHSEWSEITWWDAVDYIGIDAFFPLAGSDNPSVACIQDAWSGKSTHCSLAPQNQGDVFDKMASLSGKFNRPIIFTGAGYESASGASGNPGKAVFNNTDELEQLQDMQGLIQTFQSQSWWLGVIWSYDYAVWPRANLASVVEISGGNSASPFDLDYSNIEADWTLNTEWAGSCLTATTANGNCSSTNNFPAAKQAGQWFNTFYQVKPLPPLSAIQ